MTSAVHVVTHKKGWSVRLSGRKKSYSTHDDYDAALCAGKLLAVRNKSVLYVHGRDGRVKQCLDIPNDPVITVCQGEPMCDLKDDDAVYQAENGCPMCRRIVIHADGTETEHQKATN